MPSLQNYSTFRLNTQCAFVHTFSDVPSFLSLFSASHSASQPTYILGGGSNTIFVDDFNGSILVNKIRGISHYDTESAHFIRVGAGENWHDFVTLCIENKWYGLENLALIPGSVGASPIQNIGAYGKEVNAFIDTVEGIMLPDGKEVLFTNQDCQFGYRDSIFKNELAWRVLITHVNFKLPKQYELETSYGELKTLTQATPERIYNKVIEIRQRKLPDPEKLGNAGSFFKNPVIDKAQFQQLIARFSDIPHFMVGQDKVKIPAAWFIDRAGFKGYTLNEVRCHPTQPLVLTNLGAAKGEDVLSMAKMIIASVAERFKVTLEPEVRLLGKKGLITL